jgi:amino acid transporter
LTAIWKYDLRYCGGVEDWCSTRFIDLFILPLIQGYVGSPWFIYAWIAGALLSLVDSLIWSELGAALPNAGGSFYFLRTAYGEKSWGKLMSFLYTWQTMIQAPLVIASGAIGFSYYAGYLFELNDITSRILSGGVVILLTVLLYRNISTIGKMSTMLWVGVVGTILWIIWGGLQNGQLFEPIKVMNDGLLYFFCLKASRSSSDITTSIV